MGSQAQKCESLCRIISIYKQYQRRRREKALTNFKPDTKKNFVSTIPINAISYFHFTSLHNLVCNIEYTRFDSTLLLRWRQWQRRQSQRRRLYVRIVCVAVFSLKELHFFVFSLRVSLCISLFFCGCLFLVFRLPVIFIRSDSQIDCVVLGCLWYCLCLPLNLFEYYIQWICKYECVFLYIVFALWSIQSISKTELQTITTLKELCLHIDIRNCIRFYVPQVLKFTVNICNLNNSIQISLYLSLSVK